MAKCEFLKSKFKGSMQLELDNIYSERVNIDSVKSVNEVLTLRDKAINELKWQLDILRANFLEVLKLEIYNNTQRWGHNMLCVKSFLA